MPGKVAKEARQIAEERRGNVPLFVHPEWADRFPWAVQGITPREAGNFSAFGDQSASAFVTRWRRLRLETGFSAAVLGMQIHAAQVQEHKESSPGLLLGDDSDGHITSIRATLLAVSIADCVPVFVLQPERRLVGILHAGWRGIAAGILETCVSLTGKAVHLHFGPAICGACYEVGPEVHQSLGLRRPRKNKPVDLRAVLVKQAVDLGIERERITISTWCTRCGGSPFYSHRGGDAERQVAVIGIL